VSRPKQIHLPRSWWEKIASQQAEMDLQLVDIEDEMQHFERLEQRRLAEERREERKQAAEAARKRRKRQQAAKQRREAAEAAAAAAAEEAAKLEEQKRRMQHLQRMAEEEARRERAAREERARRALDRLDGSIEDFSQGTGKDYFAELFARACRFRRVPVVAFIRHAGGPDALRSYTTELGSIQGVTRHVWEVTLPKVSLAFRYTQEKYTPEQNPRIAASICLYCRRGDDDWQSMNTPHELLKVAGSGGKSRNGLVFQAMLGAAGMYDQALQDQIIEYLKAKQKQQKEVRDG
jgi:flagellar biosynthesis GTPase FlhF